MVANRATVAASGVVTVPAKTGKDDYTVDESGARVPTKQCSKRMTAVDMKEYYAAQEKITLKIPVTEKDKNDVTVSVNGYVFQIKRGVYVDVPVGIVDRLDEAISSIAIQAPRPDGEGMVTTFSDKKRFPYEIKRG